jgi:transglutaminase-like putative cysteine protease
MKLQISHVTHYEYETTVSDSVNEIRLTPSTNDRQSCYQQSIAIEPNASLFSYEDYFGNRVHAFSVNAPHRKLVIRTNMTVVTKGAPAPQEYEQAVSGYSPELAWQWLRGNEASDRFAEFLADTDYTALQSEKRDVPRFWLGWTHCAKGLNPIFYTIPRLQTSRRQLRKCLVSGEVSAKTSRI